MTLNVRIPLITAATLLIGACASAPPVAKAPPPPPAPPPAPVEPEPEPPTREEVLAEHRLTIAAVGDIMLGTDFPEDRLPADDGRGQLAEAAALITVADVGFGNLEGTLMDGGEPVKKCSNPEACYLFRSPARFAGTLSDAGFDVMSLANNHARDFGEVGRTATMNALDSVGIHHSGRVGDVASWKIQEVDVAMVAFSTTGGAHSMLEIPEAASLVGELSREHDLVLVSFHGGAEGLDAEHVPFSEESYYGENRGDVVAFARAMVDAGADLVIGHGPHVPRAMELHRQRLILYSLGNFATYYGISVEGVKGVAPLAVITVDGHGRFVSGRIESFRQIRPQGPSSDATNAAYRKIRQLTVLDFGGGGLKFTDRNGFAPAESAASLP